MNVHRTSARVSTAQRALRSAADLEPLDVEQHGADPRGADVDPVEVRRDRRVTELGVVVGSHAADEHLGVALLRADLDVGRGTGASRTELIPERDRFLYAFGIATS